MSKNSKAFVRAEACPAVNPPNFGLFAGAPPLRRRPRRGYAPSLDGHFAALKALGPAPFESLLERDFQMLMNADPSIRSYAVQSHQLLYEAPDKNWRMTKHLYTPDYTALDQHGRIIVMEVKAKGLADSERWSRLEPYIKRAYQKLGVHFIVFTERTIRAQPRLSNCALMLMYGRDPLDQAAEIVIRTALSAFSKATKIENVCEVVSKRQIDSKRTFSTLMHLALRGVVQLDLSKPITMQSALKVAG